MQPSKPQRQVMNSGARFRVLVSGRRFGKTALAVEEMAKAAAPIGRKVWYVAPTYRQAKQIAWTILKDRLLPLHWVEKIDEGDLSLLLTSGSTISLRGADNFDSLRGVGIHFLVMDEFADIREDAWTKVLRATLSDTGGRALFTGTPKGRNWAHRLYQTGLQGDREWASFQYTTLEGGNVPPEEVEAARRDLDELTFQQEYEASFVSFEGRVYYPFSEGLHYAPGLSAKYDPRQPLIICLDFNAAPGVAAICQELPLPNGQPGTAVIGEVHIPRNSNTPAVCRKIAHDWGEHQGRVLFYGDATGAAKGSAKVLGSDWDLVRAELRPVFGDRLHFRVPPANPPERVRVNAVNCRLKSAAGEVRLMVDQAKAPHVVQDLEGVVMLAGGAGEIDKRATPELTHISDALGYYIVAEYPAAGRMSYPIRNWRDGAL